MKARVAIKNEEIGRIEIREVEAKERRIAVGKKTIRVAVHPNVMDPTLWTVTVPELGARLAWGESEMEAMEAAKKKVHAIGYARYWESVRLHQSKVLGGKNVWKAKGGLLKGYLALHKTKLAKDNRAILKAAGALQ